MRSNDAEAQIMYCRDLVCLSCELDRCARDREGNEETVAWTLDDPPRVSCDLRRQALIEKIELITRRAGDSTLHRPDA